MEPVINDHWERAEFPYEILPALRDTGVVGTYIQGYGCPGMSRLEAGLVAREMGRVDGSVNTFLGVHANLGMGSIYILGNEEQRQRWLPAMARLEKTGAFALTEPAHGPTPSPSRPPPAATATRGSSTATSAGSATELPET